MTLAALLAIAVATLTPGSDRRGATFTTPLWCLVCGDQGGADVAANLLLFLPFAIALRLTGASWRRVVALSAAVSFTVELLQLTVVPGRDASLSDLLSNTTSGAIGAALAPRLPGLVLPAQRQARGLLAWGGGAWLAALAVSAWLLAPGVPSGGVGSYWAGVVHTGDEFHGRVLAVELDGMPMPAAGRLGNRAAATRARLARGDFSLRVSLRSDRPRPGRAWIWILEVGPGTALSVYQDGRAAGVSVPSRGLRFRLRQVAMTVSGALPGDSGVRVRLAAAEHARRVSLASEFGGTRHAAELTLSPAIGWMLISPFDPPPVAGVRWITGLLLGASLVPLGLWARRSGRPAPALALLAAIAAAGLAALPALAGFPPVHWSEWLAAGLGAAAGWALGPAAAYLERRCASPSDSESSSS